MYRSALRVAVFCLALAGPAWVQAQHKMDDKKIEKALRKAGVELEGERGSWLAYHGKRVLLVLSDEQNNRMRIFTPIIEEKEIGPSQKERMLRANFHSALDAKYSIYEGYVVSVFTHPLRELSESQLLDAIHQVVNLADTFGTTYSSTELIFDGEGENEKKEDEAMDKRS
ncbi:MAG: hypothetical protein KDC66_06350 [Phaeodactylibacter sp.]|nr:hypothetical protein [Phaeodactylibacter sp.]MCB9272404.1 hypothetical protein [Lewinellaceae bacterium]